MLEALAKEKQTKDVKSIDVEREETRTLSVIDDTIV